MAQAKTFWVDHVVEKPHTYKETANGDGTNTYTEAFGKVIQQGTPINAANLNKLENTLMYLHTAYDMTATLTQAKLRALENSDTIAQIQAAIEEMQTNMRLAFELSDTLHQAEIRGNRQRIEALEKKVVELAVE